MSDHVTHDSASSTICDASAANHDDRPAGSFRKLWMFLIALFVLIGAPLVGANPGPATTSVERIPYRFVEPVTEQHKYPVVEALLQAGYEASIVFFDTSEPMVDELIIDVSSREFVMPLNIDAVEIAHVHDGALVHSTKICLDMRWFRGYHGSERLYTYALQEIQIALSLRRSRAGSPTQHGHNRRRPPSLRCDIHSSVLSGGDNTATIDRCYASVSLFDIAAEANTITRRSISKPPLTTRVSEGVTPVWVGRPATGLAISTPQYPTGTHKRQLAYLNNNPGNLRHAPGASVGVGGFAKFRTLQDGYCAYESYVIGHAERGLTLTQFIQEYAPPSENRTVEYLKSAVQALHVPGATRLIDIPIMRIAEFQLMVESATLLSGPGLAASSGSAACQGVAVISRVTPRNADDE